MRKKTPVGRQGQRELEKRMEKFSGEGNTGYFFEIFSKINMPVEIYKAVDGGRDFILVDGNLAAGKGQETKKGRIFGKSVSRIFPSAEKSGLLRSMRSALGTGKSEYNPSIFFNGPEGTGWREGHIFRVGPRHVAVSCQDITGKRNVLFSLKEAMAVWDTTFDAVKEVICLVDTEERVRRVNAAVEKTLGCPRQKVLGKELCAVFGKGKGHLKNCVFQKTLRTLKRETAEIGIGEQCLRLTADPVFNDAGGLAGGVITIYDMTEEKKIKETVRQTNEFAKTVIDNMNDELSIIDARTYRVVGWNNAYLKSLGRKENEVYGKTCYEITRKRKSPCTPPEGACPLRETVKNNAHASAEHIHFNDRGEKMYVEISTTPIRGENGEVERVVHIAKDITERKNSEHMKDALIRDITHTLRTPVAMMEMANERMAKGIKLKDPGRIKANQKLLTRSIDRLRREIKSILDIFALTEGKHLDRKNINIREEVDNILRNYAYRVKKLKLRIKTRVQKSAEKVFMSRTELVTLLSNIIDNAVKFAPTNNGKINLSVISKRETIVIKITDNGCGIEPDKCEAVLEKFYKLHPAIPGTGLGLAICREIAERNGGSIKVLSRGVNMGTTVMVFLPKKKE